MDAKVELLLKVILIVLLIFILKNPGFLQNGNPNQEACQSTGGEWTPTSMATQGECACPDDLIFIPLEGCKNQEGEKK